jgi:hypothetical protein
MGNRRNRDQHRSRANSQSRELGDTSMSQTSLYPLRFDPIYQYRL